MKYPQLKTDGRSSTGAYKVTTRDTIQAFRGYDHNLRISDDEFFFTENVSLDLYPVLSQRHKRGILGSVYTANGGIFAADRMCWINGRVLYYNGVAIKSDLRSDLVGVQRQFAAMGAYIVIFPDKLWFNTSASPITVSSLGASYTTVGNTVYTLCDIDGNAYSATVNSAAPDSPANGDYWVDTSGSPHVLKQYSSTSSSWVTIPTTYVKLAATGIGANFKDDDVVHFTNGYGDLADTDQQLYKCDTNYIITTGIIDLTYTQTTAVTIERKVPSLDYITESNNRLWGCSSANHEIYACKLGDPTNWYCYQGLVSDSYAATIGSAGTFTGAATLGNYVLFFKADCMHKVYGSQPSNYQVIEVTCRGVQGGSDKSLAVVNEVLYYLSRDGVVAYDGSLPYSVSKQFGQELYTEGVAGALNGKYYICVKDSSDSYHLFVYDTEKGMWVREDDTQAKSFTYLDGDLYFTNGSNRMCCVKGSNGTLEDDFDWIVESGDIGLSLADQKYVTRIVMRMEISDSAKLYVSYDGGEYSLVEDIEAQGLDSVYVAIQPIRCDHMRIKLTGYRDFKLYSISKTIEQGSEINVRG